MTASPAPRIALIGAGLMGAGLARIFARVGWPVALFDVDSAAVDRVMALVPGVRAGRDLADAVTDADLVIEAVSEKPSLKQAIFAELAALTGDHTILATNSSVIPVAVVAEKVPDHAAGRVLGTHFWNPPDIIPLVEVIKGPRTAAASIDRAMAWLRAAGKEPVPVQRDTVPGNRLQHALWREAMALVDEGVCTPADVDHIVKRSFGLRLPVLGPLENADLVGLDLTEQIHSVVLPTLSRATTPSPSLTRRLVGGDTGVKSGAGFYADWTAETVTALRQRLNAHLEAVLSPAPSQKSREEEA